MLFRYNGISVHNVKFPHNAPNQVNWSAQNPLDLRISQ